MAEPTTAKRQRKSKARPREVVIALLEERLRMITGNEDHALRMTELLDELKRSKVETTASDEEAA